MQTVKFEDKDFFIDISRTKDDKVHIALTETLDSVDKRGEVNPSTYDLLEIGE